MTRVAIVGGGAAGLAAAHRLVVAGLDVTLFESASQLGGNCMAVEVRDRLGSTFRLDAGVSDFNRRTFHRFAGLMDELGLESRPISQDASFADREGRSVLSSVSGKWRHGSSTVDPAALEQEIAAFRRRSVEVLVNRHFGSWTVGRYLEHLGMSDDFARFFLLPRAMGCFAMPGGDPNEFPIGALIRFWAIHGLVGEDPGDRRCLVGGMHRYPEIFGRWLRERGVELLTGHRVLGVERDGHGVALDAKSRRRPAVRRLFDHVLLTGHARHSLRLLASPSPLEKRLLSSFPWQRARVVVHQDESLMARHREEWGAFNFSVPEGEWPRNRPTITFYPNRLASLPPEVPDTFVSLNPVREPAAEKVISTRILPHPQIGAKSEWLAGCLEEIQGRGRTWFAGSYLRTPAVHESAFESGHETAEKLIEFESRDSNRDVPQRRSFLTGWPTSRRRGVCGIEGPLAR